MHNKRRRGKRLGHHDQVPATNDELRRGQRPGATITYLRCTTSGAAGDGLGTVIKYLRAAAGIGLGKHDQVPARRRRHWSWHHDQVPATLNERRREQRPGHHDQVPLEKKRGRGQQLGQGPHTQIMGTNSDESPVV
jgi:hypothetical protein